MGLIKYIFLLLIKIYTLQFASGINNNMQISSLNCQNFTVIKRPFEIILEDEFDFDQNPESIEIIVHKLHTNSENIRQSLCNIKTSFDREIYLAEIEADTFNNDRLEQLDGTVTSRRVGTALRNTVLKVGECVSNVAKQVLLAPLRVKPEIPCVTRELLLLRNFSTNIANTITSSLKSIVHYPRHIILCFKSEQIMNCLSKLHKKVINGTLTDIMKIINKSVKMGQILYYSGLNIVEKQLTCPEFHTNIAKLAMIPLKLTYCIENKIY